MGKPWDSVAHGSPEPALEGLPLSVNSVLGGCLRLKGKIRAELTPQIVSALRLLN